MKDFKLKFAVVFLIFAIVSGAMSAVIVRGIDVINSSTPPEGYTPVEATPRSFIPLQPDVLILQQTLPWGSNADATVIGSLGYTYEIKNMSDVPSLDLSKYCFVLIVNDQSQSFYDSYATNYSIFQNYVENGGMLVFFAAGYGWGGGHLNAPLPGGVTTVQDYDNYNLISDSNHPIVTDELTEGIPLTNTDLYSTYCSHVSFNNLSAQVSLGSIKNLDIILEAKNSGLPTLIEYQVGNGLVIASGNTWEYTYVNRPSPNFSTKALDDVFVYACINTITATAGPGGTISPSGKVRVANGGSQTFTIKANEGYMISQVLVDGLPVLLTSSSVMTYTFNNVTSDHTISASFAVIPIISLYKVKAYAAYGNAQVTPPEQIVQGGSSVSIFINPDAGYYITGLTDNGVSISLNSIVNNGNDTYTYTIPFVSEDHIVIVTLEKHKYTIFAIAGEGGKISPSGSISVQYGSKQVFNIIPDSGFRINQIIIDDNPIASTESIFEFNNISGNHTINVTFSRLPIASSIMIELKIDSPYIVINGTSMKIDAQGSKPMIKDGRTFLPIRKLIESLGGTVEWDASEQKVTILLNGHSIILYIGKANALVDGNAVTLDVAPFILNNRTYLPLRFVSENLGAVVEWNASNKTVTIYYWQ